MIETPSRQDTAHIRVHTLYLLLPTMAYYHMSLPLSQSTIILLVLAQEIRFSHEYVSLYNKICAVECCWWSGQTCEIYMDTISYNLIITVGWLQPSSKNTADVLSVTLTCECYPFISSSMSPIYLPVIRLGIIQLAYLLSICYPHKCPR